MCGIVGYVGKKEALPILLQGLRRLEYRGYDSAGLSIINTQGLERVRAVGRIDNLSEKIKEKKIQGTIGIAHTRWATHGGVTERNAHPHTDCSGALALVHNGIIENYKELKEKLSPKHKFESETDSEVLAHLIEDHYEGDLRKAVIKALAHVRGTYGIAVIHRDQPDTMVAARLGSPLVVGVNDDEFFIASDATPILPYTRKVMFLNDGELVEISHGELNTYTVDDQVIQKCTEMIDWNDEQAQKQNYPHFMLKEINEQPEVLMDAIRGRIDLEQGTAHLGGVNLTEEEMRSIDRLLLISCGTAYYAALIGKYAFERLADIPVEVDVASEFRYRDPIVTEKTLAFAISQSGETADTLAALREVKRKGAMARGIVNMVGSTIAREAGAGTYIHAGPELAVASTKAFINMVAVLILYAIQFGRLKRVTSATGARILKELLEVPDKMRIVLKQSEQIKEVAKKYQNYKNFMYLGRDINYPVALEGALKLKEVSYIHSEAYPGGEMKHGPLAMLSADFPVVAIMTQNALYDKMCNNVEEVKARGVKVIAVATQGDERAKELADDVIYVPAATGIVEPLINVIPLQLFAYHMAVLLGKDVDRPRNLAKSVTVE